MQSKKTQTIVVLFITKTRSGVYVNGQSCFQRQANHGFIIKPIEQVKREMFCLVSCVGCLRIEQAKKVVASYLVKASAFVSLAL